MPAAPARDGPGRAPQPRLAGSTTGYVENGFIGWQVPFRFNAGRDRHAGSPSSSTRSADATGWPASIRRARPGDRPSPGRPDNTPLIENDLTYRDFQFYGESALHPRFSLFADVPIRSLSPTSSPRRPASATCGCRVKVGLVASDTTALTFQLRSVLPSGDSEKGLGTAYTGPSTSGCSTTVWIVGPFHVGAEFGTWHPIGGASPTRPCRTRHEGRRLVGRRAAVPRRRGLRSRRRPGFGVRAGRRIVRLARHGGYLPVTPDGTPGKLQILSAEGTDIVNLKVGGRFTFNGRHSVYAATAFR